MPTKHERALHEQQRAKQKKTQQYVYWGLGVVAIVVVVGLVLASGVLTPRPSTVAAEAPLTGATCDAIQAFATQSQDHIAPNQPHPPYNTNPPNSGWHWANPQDWGVYSTPQVQEQLVHNLEHGGIVIQYNDLPPADVQRLVNLVNQDSHHMILAPYPGLPSGVKVAMTAWDHLRTCTGVDENAIMAFINGLRDKGPESVP